MKLQARLTYDTVAFDKDTDAHLVVSLVAPKIDWQAQRPAVCLIPCIDISTSMQGQKLEYAKMSVLKLIDHLQPGDFCGIVTFGSVAATLAPPKEMTQAGKEALKAQVGGLSVSGNTNFSGGLTTSLEHLNQGDLPDGMLRRAIMFTDGQANTGAATLPKDILALLDKVLGKGTVSAFGYGPDANQDMLADVAKHGKGNYAFIRNPEDALSAFAKELGGLLSTYAQNLVIELNPSNGHRITETVSDVTAEEDGKKVTVKLPELLSEEERHLVFAVRLDAQAKAFPRQSTVFEVTVKYDLLDAGTPKAQTEELKAKVQFVKAADAQTKPDPEVDRIVGLQQLVQAQVAAEERAKRGDYAGAAQVMHVTCDSYQARGLGDLAQVAVNVSAKMDNAHTYAASSGYLNSMRSAGTRAVGTSSLDASAAADIGFLGVSTSNEAQSGTVAQFTHDQNNVSVVGGQNLAGKLVAPSPYFQPGQPNPHVPVVNLHPQAVVNLPDLLKNAAAPVLVTPVIPSKVTKEKSKRW